MIVSTRLRSTTGGYPFCQREETAGIGTYETVTVDVPALPETVTVRVTVLPGSVVTLPGPCTVVVDVTVCTGPGVSTVDTEQGPAGEFGPQFTDTVLVVTEPGSCIVDTDVSVIV